MDRKVLKELIVKNELLNDERLRELEALSASSGSSLVSTIVNGNYIKEDVLLPVIGSFFGIEWQDIEKLEKTDSSLYASLPDDLKDDQQTFLPLYKENGKVVVAVSNVVDVDPLDYLRNKTGWKLKVVLSLQEKINKLRKEFKNEGRSVEDALTEMGDGTGLDKSLEDLANEAPTIKRVNLIIMQAISEGASDIHIEPYENRAVVRYRSDGVLRETATHTKEHFPAIISRVKIMADLNIAERRIPQDGRITLKLMDRIYDLRVATIPTMHGEGVVMRILDKSNIELDLKDLGFNEVVLEGLKKLIRMPHGIILVTGPTGSGKTTSLYAALASIKSVTNKIITIEDPVEYGLDGITQIHVNAKVGLTFAAGLRSVLRLDPDVVMVGEIRDTETAEIAIRSALTGHLVFSTLHTNDASSAINRLVDMKIASYLISSSLNAILAQRLVRKICEFCKTEKIVDALNEPILKEAGMIGQKPIYSGKGCFECNNTGYSGRDGIYELLVVSADIRELISNNASTDDIRKKLKEEGMKTMRDDGVSKILKGITTTEEVLRVTQTE